MCISSLLTPYNVAFYLNSNLMPVLVPLVKSLDGITGGVPLNCSQAGSDGEDTSNYLCSYAPISRDGWAVYNDAAKCVICNLSHVLYRHS